MRASQEVGESDEDVKMHVYERTYGKIERMFRLPDNVEDEKIEAHMKNGVLTVHIRQTPRRPRRRFPSAPSRSSERARATSDGVRNDRHAMAGRFGRETRATSARVTRIMHRLERRTLPVSVRKRNPDAARARLSDDALPSSHRLI